MVKLRIHSKEIQTDYADLIALADLEPSSQSQIDDSDLRLYKINTGQSFAVKLYSEQGQEKKIQDRDSLNQIFSNLKTLDTDHDGVIENRYRKKNAFFDLPDTIPNAVPSNLKEIGNRYSSSIFAIAITTDAPKTGDSSGTAFVAECLPNNDGTYQIRLLTNTHIVDKYNIAEIGFRITDADDNLITSEVRVIGSDPMADVGVLEFTSNKPFLPIPINNPVQSDFYLGEPLVEISNTMGLGINTQVVNVNRDHTSFGEYGIAFNDNYPFATTTIRGDTRNGNSGSPLITQNEEFAGIHFGGITIELGENQYWYGSFLPANRVLKSYQNILAHQETKGVVYSDWGLSAMPLGTHDPFWQNHPQLGHQGIVIAKVFNDGAAANAGLMPGDILLTASLENEKTAFDIHDEDQMYRFLTYTLDSTPDQNYTLNIYRPSEDRFLTLTLNPRPRSFNPTSYMTTQQGFAVYDVPEAIQWREQDFFAAHPGIMIDVPDNAPLLRNRKMRAQMIVTAINNIPTPDVPSFKKEYNRCQKTGEPYTLTLMSTPFAFYKSEGGSGVVYYESFTFY